MVLKHLKSLDTYMSKSMARPLKEIMHKEVSETFALMFLLVPSIPYMVKDLSGESS